MRDAWEGNDNGDEGHNGFAMMWIACVFLVDLFTRMCFLRENFFYPVKLEFDPINPYICEAARRVLNQPRLPCNGKKCVRIIMGWKGRWANQFWSIVKAIQIAKKTGIRLIRTPYNWGLFKKPFMFQKILVQPDQTPKREADNCFDFNTYFRVDNLPPVNLTLDEEFRLLFTKQIDNYIEEVPDDVLVIHIRSGDVFIEEWPEVHDYAQPPCMYYKDMMSMGNWSKVWLFAEDTKNPCVDYVRKFKNVIWKEGYSIEQIIGVAVGAKHLAFGRGSLGLGFAAIAKDLQTLFTYNMSTGQFKAKRHYNCVPTKSYYENVIKIFRSTPQQREAQRSSIGCREWEDIPYDPGERTIYIHDGHL